MALVILPGLNNLIEDISEEKKLPPNVVEAAIRPKSSFSGVTSKTTVSPI